jgi:hypothetical protein
MVMSEREQQPESSPAISSKGLLVVIGLATALLLTAIGVLLHALTTRSRDAVVEADFIELSTPISGRLVSLKGETGTALSQGDPLAMVENPRASEAEIRRIGRVLMDGRGLWGTNVDLSEEGADFALQQPSSNLQLGEVTLELMEPPLRLPAHLVRAQGQSLALQFHRNDAAIDAALISLIYDGRHWFHRPRRLHTIDAFLRWIGTLIRPDPILKRFSG